MLYIDSHIHLQDYRTQSINNVIIEAQKNGVKMFFNASAHPSDWEKVDSLAKQYPLQIIPAFGIHPWAIADADANWVQKLEFYLQYNPRAMVGECGIDRLKNKDITLQLEVFLRHIELAQKYNRPLIIHAVKAEEQILPLLPKMPKKTIFHSYSGSLNFALKIQSCGFYLGFNFASLRRNNFAELLQNIDLDYILLESDGPYQSFTKGCETMPKDLPTLLQKIAELKPAEFAQMQKILYRNQQRFLSEE